MFHHEAPIVGERAEVISLVDGNESAKRMKAFAGAERDSLGEAHGNLGVRGIRHGYGQGNQLRPGFDMSHSNSNVTPPDVDNRRAATIIAGVHALIILLLKIGVQRYDPVGAFFIGAALVRPESWRAHSALRVQNVGIVGPTIDRKLGCSGIGVLNLEEGHRRKVRVSHLRLLQAQDVGPRVGQPLLHTWEAGLERVHVPGGDPHPRASLCPMDALLWSDYL